MWSTGSLAVFLGLGALAFFHIAHAQQVFTYQGKLRGAAGPVSGVCDFEFNLYDVPAGGVPLGTVALDNVTVQAGLFTVQLSFGAGSFNGRARWLEAAVRCPGDSGFTTLPRQQIAASPYAITSFSTEGLQGVPVSDARPAHSEVLKFNAITGAWEPAADATGDGDITKVIAGTGLTGTASSGEADLSVLPSEFMTLESYTDTIGGRGALSDNARKYYTINCPDGYVAMAGGAGHRDNNDAAYDIVSGSAPLDDNTWLATVSNSSTEDRAVVLWVLCINQ